MEFKTGDILSSVMLDNFKIKVIIFPNCEVIESDTINFKVGDNYHIDEFEIDIGAFILDETYKNTDNIYSELLSLINNKFKI